MLLGQGDGGFHRIFVQFVEDVVLSTYQASVFNAALGLHIRDMLYTNHNLHRAKRAIRGRLGYTFVPGTTLHIHS